MRMHPHCKITHFPRKSQLHFTRITVYFSSKEKYTAQSYNITPKHANKLR